MKCPRLQAWAVALALASAEASHAFAQSPAPAAADPPRRAVDSSDLLLPGTLQLPSVPGAAAPLPAVPGNTRDAVRPLDGLDEILIAPPSSPNHRFPLDASWDNGLWFESADKQFRVHVGGNAQIDSTWLIGPHGGFNLPSGGTNGTENSSSIFLRRVRLRADGSIYDQFDYIVEYDFANANNENDGLQPPSFGNITGAPAPCNIWMQVRDVPYLGNVRVGNLVKPIGLSNNTSQANLPFLERPDNMDAFWGPFDSGFALGATARSWSESERVTWQYGVYRPAINVFGVALDKGSYGGRITALPVYEDDGERLIHVGFGTFDGELVEDDLRVRARTILRNGPGYAVPILVDTENIQGSRQYTLAPEFAAVCGPWTLQAEWTGQFLTQATLDGQVQSTSFFHGGYVEALYFLTGEHQAYDKRDGSFGEVIPRTNYRIKPGAAECGFGAWQVGARFSYLDLNDKAIQGGQLYDWTAGLNWYLNPNMKVQFNYVLEHRDQPGVPPGWINGVGVRAAYSF